mmetsp:Transcript_28580/g.87496  ORF Transcript_28580/g.87496 Transcript_28580/m.87496 type:complete len:206 (+) Transcript_28580:1060-1677(+)
MLSGSRWRMELPTSRKSFTCHVCLTRRERVRLRRSPSFRVWARSTMRRYSSSFSSCSLIFAAAASAEFLILPLVSSNSDCVSCSELKWSQRDFSQRACILSFSSRRTARCAETLLSSACAVSRKVLNCAARDSVCLSRVVASASCFCRSNTWASLSACSDARRLISTSKRFSSSASRATLRCSSVEVVVEVDWCSSNWVFRYVTR